MTRKAFSVFVVDENAARRDAVAGALRLCGLRVAEGRAGAQAVNAAHQQLDVIISGAHLGDMDGAELYCRLKDDPSTADIPLLQLRESQAEPHQEVASQCRADDYLDNPEDLPALLSKVKVWARLARAERELRSRSAELELARKELLQLQRGIEKDERSQDALAARPDFSSAILETAATLIVVLDPRGCITYFNPACEAISGYSAAEACGRSFLDFVPPEDAEIVQAGLDALHAGSTLSQHERSWVMKDGTRRVISWWNTCLRHNDGSLEYIVATGIDVTDWKRAEESLRQSERELQTVLDAAPAAVILTDASGRVLRTSPETSTVFGYPITGNAQGTEGAYEFCTPDGLPIPPSRTPLSLALTGNAVPGMHLLIRRKDGTRATLLASATPVHGESGRITGAVMVYKDISNYMSAEQALRDSERRYHSLFDHMVEGFFLAEIICTDAGEPVDYRYLDVNPAFERLTGLKREEVIGRTIRELLPAVEEHWITDCGRVALTGEPIRMCEYSAPFGRYYETMAYSPAPRQFACFFSNVTERQRAQEELCRAAERFRIMGEVLPYGLWWCNEHGGIEYASQSFLDLLGMSMEQVRESGWTRRLLPEEVQPLVQKWKRCVESGEDWDGEYHLLGPDGNYHSLLTRGKPVRNAAGKIIGWAGINLDIDQLKQAEQALRESEARFRAVVENIPQMVWVADSAAHFQYLSPKWLQYTGTTEQENAGTGWIDALHPDDRAHTLERWKTAVGTRANYEAEYRLRRWDGEYRWHSARALTLESSTEGPLWFGTITDIHDQKLTQELLIRSEKVAALGRMAATLAHDINNPLAAAMNTLYLARSIDGLPELAKQYLETTDAELKRIAHISRQALGFYRENSRPAPVSVESTVSEAIALFRSKIKARHIKVEQEYEPQCNVMAISGELRQVLCNLIANSLDAVPENGVIKVRVAKRTDSRSGTPLVRVSVADSGAGIASGSMPRLFEPLFTTKGSVGTGLGLWVSRQLIEKHGGRIYVRSSVQGRRRGTTFLVVLPAHLPAQANRSCCAR